MTSTKGDAVTSTKGKEDDLAYTTNPSPWAQKAIRRNHQIMARMRERLHDNKGAQRKLKERAGTYFYAKSQLPRPLNRGVSTRAHRQSAPRLVGLTGRRGTCAAQALATVTRAVMHWLKKNCPGDPKYQKPPFMPLESHEALLVKFSKALYDDDAITSVFEGLTQRGVREILNAHGCSVTMTNSRTSVIEKLRTNPAAHAVIAIKVKTGAFARKIANFGYDIANGKIADNTAFGRAQFYQDDVTADDLPVRASRLFASWYRGDKPWYHAMAISGFELDNPGWTSEDGIPQGTWEIKNSWGPSWADSGFFRLSMDTFDGCSPFHLDVLESAIEKLMKGHKEQRANKLEGFARAIKYLQLRVCEVQYLIVQPLGGGC